MNRQFVETRDIVSVRCKKEVMLERQDILCLANVLA